MADWPFVGRVDELHRLRELVTSERFHGLVLAGQAGVGKTRVAQECLRLAERDGLATVQVTATQSASTLPFGALAPLLPRDAHARGAVDDQAWLLRRSASALVDDAGRRLILFVDDAHLLDDASAILVHHLALSGAAFVLVTTRIGEPVRDPIVALWRDGLAERVELGALPEQVVLDLLSTALGGPVDAGTAATLAEHAQGNVLFLRELVLGSQETGALADDGGHWRLRGRLTPSDRLVELVEARLGDLEPPERALLELVAHGEPLGQAVLAALGDTDVAEALERRGLLASRVAGRRLEVRLAHPLYGDVLRAGMAAGRERALARALAGAVEATGARRREDTLRVASWWLTGGGGRPEALLAGASAARWRYDFALAERLADAALHAGAGFDAALLTAELALLQGRTAEAERRLAVLAPQATDDAQRGAVALLRVDAATWSGRDDQHVVDDALATIADPALRDALEAGRANFVHYTRGPRAAVDAATPLLERAQGRALAQTCVFAAYNLGRLGRIHEALDTATKGHAAQMATTDPLPWYPWYHDLTRCQVLQYAGQFREAGVLADRHYERAVADGSTEAIAMFGTVTAAAARERGRLGTAVARAREAVAFGQEFGRPVITRIGRVYEALTLALAGRTREAEESLRAVDDIPMPATVLHAVDLAEARAWTEASAGDMAAAREHLERAAALGEELGDLVGATSALTGLARLGRAGDVRRRLAAVAVHVEGDLAPALVAYVEALADHDADRLESMSGTFEAMGADLLAAEAAAEAAVVRRRAGERRAATADQRRAAALAERCEGAVTPALQGIEIRALLTNAEHETALLAATGLSSRRIAEQLCLSVRTVENRLQRVYDKLGVSGRAELADTLDTTWP